MNDDERKRWSWNPLVAIKYDGRTVGLIASLALLLLPLIAWGIWVFDFGPKVLPLGRGQANYTPTIPTMKSQ